MGGLVLFCQLVLATLIQPLLIDRETTMREILLQLITPSRKYLLIHPNHQLLTLHKLLQKPKLINHHKLPNIPHILKANLASIALPARNLFLNRP